MKLKKIIFPILFLCLIFMNGLNYLRNQDNFYIFLMTVCIAFFIQSIWEALR